MITLIAAASLNNVIGNNGDIPWKLRNDFKHFKELTTGHPMIMGRKTFDSLPGVLPNRKHVVITRSKKQSDNENVEYVNSLEEAFELTSALKMGTKVFVIGGGEIYAQALQFAKNIELTIVFTECPGDAHFPEIPEDFECINVEQHFADENHKYNYDFKTYVRN